MANRMRTVHKQLNCFKSLFVTCRYVSSHDSQRFNQSKTETHFGYQTVVEDEKEERVYEVFKNVADKYDLMNDVMSAGVHRLWKDYFMSRLAPTSETNLLDVAGGTGDIAFRFLNYVKSSTAEAYDFSDSKLDLDADDVVVDQEPEKPDAVNSMGSVAKPHVTVLDINQNMLDVGKKRAKESGIHKGMSWLCANAEKLPIPDNSYDAYTIAFGIRNCTHVDRVLTEAYRVLRPGGRFMCLEFSHVENPVLRRFYDTYSFEVIPVMGKLIAGDWKSYQYLVESIRKFPNQEDFKLMLEDAEFKMVSYENLTLGVAAIHSGFKL
ncbi:PREDICTED: 2-methoxy-6-polyprenyl-1,4-benzoquinol methylase, mitochondrial-like [Priapulus caudatus]|uniref:2-methoxy-6-polyprenyl-1,4-benzoquinol methylase, mitochondrial n=1 Tax=Priapulus caudatus TaxID=37621 RepID=A0ABM1DYD7_PRICU|nr:PREDICTED: 2-methoxy-6-polyprenyl-1,4-benzoquinol methylase, mitochondrial-like [Priapulus caudatus]